jgi:hypothetical protein
LITIEETKFDYNLDNIFDKDNVVGEMLRTRGEFTSDPDNYVIKSSRVEITMNNKNIVWGKSYETIGPSIEEEDGIIYFSSCPTPEEVAAKELDGRFLISTGTICVGYWCNNAIIKQSEDFFKQKEEEMDSLEKTRYSFVESGLVFVIEASLFSVLKRLFPDKEVLHKKRGILIDRKTVAAGTLLRNSTGVFSNTCVIYNYDDELYKRILTDREYRGVNGNTFSGLKQMGITLTEKEFIDLWKKEMKEFFRRGITAKDRVVNSVPSKVII